MKKLSEQVKEVDNHLAGMKEDSMVAVLLQNWKKYHVIGKVLKINPSDFTIHYWKGSYGKSWSPLMLFDKSKRPFAYTDVLPKACIILSNFILEENGKLTNEQKKFLALF